MASLLRRIKRRPGRQPRDGVAAVEFAMVAAPFFFMMFAIIEIGLIFVISSVLENATLQASRLIRTGQADTENISAAAFKTALCANMSVFENDCDARAAIDVRVIPQFRTPPDPIASGELDPSALTYLPGDPGSLVLIRVWYAQPLATPFMSRALSRLESGDVMISATTAFRNEPYDP
jgi:Flp pilus assembly protein TadG